MEATTQINFIDTITYNNNTIEFIQHEDYHYWLYYNGTLTDTYFPRHLEYTKDLKELYDELRFGSSRYNRKRIESFFADINPEYFI